MLHTTLPWNQLEKKCTSSREVTQGSQSAQPCQRPASRMAARKSVRQSVYGFHTVRRFFQAFSDFLHWTAPLFLPTEVKANIHLHLFRPIFLSLPARRTYALWVNRADGMDWELVSFYHLRVNHTSYDNDIAQVQTANINSTFVYATKAREP